MSREQYNIDTKKLADGESIEWEKLINRYHQVLVRHAHGITHDIHSANDITQMVLLNLWYQRSIAPDIKSLGAYLFRAVGNKALTYIKQRGREISYSSDIAVLTLDPKDNSPETAAQHKELKEMISIRIEWLTPKQREVIERIISDPYISTRRLAKIIGCSHKNIQAIIKRIRKRFQKIQKLLEE